MNITLIDKHREIIEAVNEKEGLTLEYGGVKYPAKLSGVKLDYPFIYALKSDKPIEAEIS